MIYFSRNLFIIIIIIIIIISIIIIIIVVVIVGIIIIIIIRIRNLICVAKMQEKKDRDAYLTDAGISGNPLNFSNSKNNKGLHMYTYVFKI